MISIESALPRLKKCIERQVPTFNAPDLVLERKHRAHILYVGAYGLANREAGKTEDLTWYEIQSKSQYEFEQLEPSLFHIGDDPRSPELIRFDVMIEGKAVQVILSGGAYSRTFTR